MAEGGLRRDPTIRRPVAELDGPGSNAEHRVLAPAVQLLYKSSAPRDKDEADFRAVREVLGDRERTWLSESLSVTSPSHPWLAHLKADRCRTPDGATRERAWPAGLDHRSLPVPEVGTG